MNKVVKILVVVAIVVSVCGVWAWKNAEKSSSEGGESLETNLSEISIGNEEMLAPAEVLPVANEMKEKEEIRDPSDESPVMQEVVEIETIKPLVSESVIEDKKNETEQLPEAKPDEVSLEEPKAEVLTGVEETVTIVTPDLVATEFDLEKLKSYKLPIMIEFGASWCTWCRWMEPTLEELNKEFSGKVVIQSVDVEKFRNEVSGFDVSLLPTIYFFDAEGNVFETRVGAMTKEDILKVFESMGVKNDG